MKLKVQGHESLIRDSNSKAIVNIASTDYQLYMKRVKMREQQGDEIRNAVKEINNLKTELLEIKNLLKEVVKK
jgi:hypothetical protein